MGKHGGDTTTKPRALAERTGSTGDQYTVTRAGRHGEPALFGLRMGRNVTDAQLAKLGGAQPDASVRLFGASDHKSLFLDIHGANNAYYATREVIRDAQGLLTIRNHNLEVHASGRVLGTRILATQVKQASRFNVARLETKAARNDTRIPPTTGYRVWPRLGYDATLPASIHAQLPAGLQYAHTIQDLYRTPYGRQWWEQHGTTLDMHFAVKAGRAARKMLSAKAAQLGIDWKTL
jgi:hypothetical protein